MFDEIVLFDQSISGRLKSPPNQYYDYFYYLPPNFVISADNCLFFSLLLFMEQKQAEIITFLMKKERIFFIRIIPINPDKVNIYCWRVTLQSKPTILN